MAAFAEEGTSVLACEPLLPLTILPTGTTWRYAGDAPSRC